MKWQASNDFIENVESKFEANVWVGPQVVLLSLTLILLSFLLFKKIGSSAISRQSKTRLLSWMGGFMLVSAFIAVELTDQMMPAKSDQDLFKQAIETVNEVDVVIGAAIGVSLIARRYKLANMLSPLALITIGMKFTGEIDGHISGLYLLNMLLVISGVFAIKAINHETTSTKAFAIMMIVNIIALSYMVAISGEVREFSQQGGNAYKENGYADIQRGVFAEVGRIAVAITIQVVFWVSHGFRKHNDVARGTSFSLKVMKDLNLSYTDIQVASELSDPIKLMDIYKEELSSGKSDLTYHPKHSKEKEMETSLLSKVFAVVASTNEDAVPMQPALANNAHGTRAP